MTPRLPQPPSTGVLLVPYSTTHRAAPTFQMVCLLMHDSHKPNLNHTLCYVKGTLSIVLDRILLYGLACLSRLSGLSAPPLITAYSSVTIWCPSAPSARQ
ncbi:hypothetical protein U9M48_035773 [Paspalum notatum var. saurae]|uniref:Uncharacterized protein n=1 Tax=Paspalum notatum var. saurae TaxID=547442 RepID=A0AAQ3X841_PASNO